MYKHHSTTDMARAAAFMTFDTTPMENGAHGPKAKHLQATQTNKTKLLSHPKQPNFTDWHTAPHYSP
jgi:hypothetical protein